MAPRSAFRPQQQVPAPAMKAYAKWSDFRNLDRERAVAAAQEQLPKWIVVLLVAAIAWQLARIAWMLVPADAVGDPVASRPAGAAGAAAAPGGADVQAIAAAHLFGEADPAAGHTVDATMLSPTRNGSTHSPM